MLNQTEEKKRYLNRYWQTRDLPSADARSHQRAEMIRSLLGEPQSEDLIDIGCGRGMVMIPLIEQGYRVSGCDLATETVGPLHADGYDAFVFDIEKDDLPDKYDGIICLEVLQQIFDPVAALGKFSKSLNENGFLIISVPNEFHLWSRLRLLAGSSHLGDFDESHIRLFNPRRARRMFERAGLHVEKVISVPVLPPGIKALGWLGKLLARFSPSLFSLSQIYKLKVR